MKAAALWLIVALPLGAQSPVTPPTRTETVINARESWMLGATAVGVALLMHSDQRISAWSQQPSLHTSGAFNTTMTGARLFGDPGSVVLGAALWAGGALTHDNVTATDGQRALEAVAVSGIATAVIKGLAGRMRPYASPNNAADFKFGRGVGGSGDAQSLPSGHATAAFAFASVITARVAQRSPGRAAWLGPLLYGAAALTGISRVYDHKHWASDVLLGAGIGTVSGLLVSRHLDHAP
jgi:membrane-associated phospholipid phosphatase